MEEERDLVGALNDGYVVGVGDESEVTKGGKGANLVGELRADEDEIELGTIVNLEGLADADGDEGLGAQSLDGKRNAAGYVSDCSVRFKDTHPDLCNSLLLLCSCSLSQ
uniref:WD repeat-containing protein 36 n=1 Tax=Rhizophora mucronata TaxID=61149 RepID=A0A2P2KHA7_RHIMU